MSSSPVVVAHVLGVAHSVTALSPTFHPNPTDAFATLTVYFARMLHRAGYVVYVYAVEGSHVDECTEVVPVVSAETYRRVYGARDDSRVNDYSDANNAAWTEFTARATDAIRTRASDERREDMVFALFGWAHQPVTEAVVAAVSQDKRKQIAVVEPMIGHPGSFAGYRVFCSYAWFYWECARQKIDHPSDYFAVIPHFLDVRDYPISLLHAKTTTTTTTTETPPYALYLGRVQFDKGLTAAIECTRVMGVTLRVVGNGRLEDAYVGRRGGHEGDDLSHVVCEGVLPLAEKRRLLAGAYCVFTLTRYCEPFSLACLEAQFCGTPVLCSKFGGFTEVVRHGVTGFHCDTLATVCDGFRRCAELDPAEIRRHAVRRFSVEAVTPYFLAYFARVRDHAAGRADWYTSRQAPPFGMGKRLECV